LKKEQILPFFCFGEKIKKFSFVYFAKIQSQVEVCMQCRHVIKVYNPSCRETFFGNHQPINQSIINLPTAIDL